MAAHHYRAYALRILSDIAFPELEEYAGTVDAAVDVTIRIAPVDVAMPAADTLRRVDFRDDSILFAWQELARVRVTGTSLIEVDPLPGADRPALRLALLGPVIAALLHRRGLLVLHAAALALPDGRAVLLAGDNGAGKSTLAAACAASGFALHGDDVCAVSGGEGALAVLPGVPTVKLARAALAALSPFPGRTLPGSLPDAAKVRVRLDAPLPAASAPARLYLVRRARTAAVTPLASGQALAMVLRHLYMLKFGTAALSGAAGIASFRQASALVDQSSAAILDVPGDLARIGEAVAAIRDDCGAPARIREPAGG